ncbi:archease [Candidatus Micrarchaeota archaeon]|nr:archease [Candidatus Micrarchaeota archaeon]
MLVLGDKYRFLDHTADVLFEAFGSTYEETLSHAALALFSTIAHVDDLQESHRFEVRAEAESLEELTNFVLSDVLSESDSSELFFKSFHVRQFQKTEHGFRLVGEARGEPYSPEKGEMHVKAVTHHQTLVEHQANGRWRIRILLDI